MIFTVSGYIAAIVFLLNCCTCISSIWNWSVNETVCSLNDSHHNVLHIRADRNASSFVTSCFAFHTQDHGTTSCEHNLFAVQFSVDTPDSSHIFCGCSGNPGIVCFNQLRLHADDSFFCIAGSKNLSLCGPGYYCGGSRSGCVASDTCKNVTDQCTNDDANPVECCCKGPFCNGWFQEDVSIATTTARPGPQVPQAVILITVFVAVTVFSTICLIMWLLYRFKRGRRLPPNLPKPEAHEMPLLSEKNNEEEPPKFEMPPPLQFANVEKLEVLSRGQRGTRMVYTAKCDGVVYAAKYFALNDYSSWDAELKIYALPHMNHENLLKFIGYTVGNPNGSPSDHAIFTEYMQMGSLQDVLRQREVSWDDLLHIASGMMCGLAYLHSAILSPDPKSAKPPIAHRDFKSRNVLLKEDLTACVADFGLALPFDSGRRTSNCGQVGTLRYMAPEVLDLAVNFSCDAFLRIDVYACGLTLWEILRRCSKPPELQASPVYEQPFETQISKIYPHCQNHPTLAEMQDIVFVRRLRPELPATGSASQSIYDLIVTIEQCWDHDSEARPSAGCVYNRIKRIREHCIRSVSSGENLLQLDAQRDSSNVSSPSPVESHQATKSADMKKENGNDEVQVHRHLNGTNSSSTPPLLDLSVNIHPNGGNGSLNGGPKVFDIVA